MIIIHTADWHIGKRTNGISRLDEQSEVLDEIAEIAKRENADVVIVSGDIFDTPMPSAEAEQVFYKAALKLSSICPLVVLSGNHDDPQRLGAPSGIAEACGIIIIDGLNNEHNFNNCKGGYGYVRIRTESGVLNLAALPYMGAAKLASLNPDGNGYSEQMKSLIDKICKEAYSEPGVNLFAAHLFMSGSENGDERELGTALQLPTDILPSGAVYHALGHVHKPQTVSKSKNAYYSGSILQYHFDDNTEKRVIKVDTDGEKVEITSIALKSGKKMIRKEVDSFDGALDALQEDNCLVELIYKGGEPFSGREITKLRQCPAFCKISVVRQKAEKEEKVNRVGKSDAELFKAFYVKNVGREPDEETVDMFLTVLRGESL